MTATILATVPSDRSNLELFPPGHTEYCCVAFKTISWCSSLEWSLVNSVQSCASSPVVSHKERGERLRGLGPNTHSLTSPLTASPLKSSSILQTDFTLHFRRSANVAIRTTNANSDFQIIDQITRPVSFRARGPPGNNCRLETGLADRIESGRRTLKLHGANTGRMQNGPRQIPLTN